MEHETQASAQPTESTEANANEGFQARINEMTAKYRQVEEQLKERDRQLMEQAARMAEQALIAQQAAARPAPAAPVDPLAQFKDTLDPVTSQAIQAAIQETTRRMEAQYAPMFAQQAAQIAQFAVQAEVQNIPGVPKEVAARAAKLAADWRAAGLNFPPGDALNFAMGEHMRGQLLKAAPVAGYNPAAQHVPQVTPGLNPPPAPARVLPPNFDGLSRQQQIDLLDKSGVADETF